MNITTCRLLIPITLCTLLCSLGGCCSSSETSENSASSKPKTPPQKAKKNTSKKTTSSAKGATPWPWPASQPNPTPPKECFYSKEPTQTHLGITSKEFITCFEHLLKNAKIPKDIGTTFKAHPKGGSFDIKDFITVLLVPDKSNNVQYAEVYLFPNQRKKHNMGPEQRATIALLAAMLPSARGSLTRGQSLFNSIHKRGKEEDTNIITSHWDSMNIVASHMGGSVRYSFKPESPKTK